MNVVESPAASTGVAARWDRFWYEERDPLSLGVFRALFAACLAMELPGTQIQSTYAVQGGFHLPYFPFPTPVSPELYQLLHAAQFPFILLLGLGALPRLSAGILLALQSYVFFADKLNFRNHPYFFQLLLLFLMFAPSGQAFSLPAAVRGLFDRARRGGTGRSSLTAPVTMQRLMQIQVSIVYFYAALHKMTAQFLGGQVLADLMGGSVSGGPVGNLLAGLLAPATLERFRASAARPEFWVPAAWLTVILEVSLPFVLWVPRWRTAAMIFGIGFHLMIGYTMRIGVFSAAMIASYLLFLDPETLPRLFGRFRGPSVAPAPATVPGKRGRNRR